MALYKRDIRGVRVEARVCLYAEWLTGKLNGPSVELPLRLRGFVHETSDQSFGHFRLAFDAIHPVGAEPAESEPTLFIRYVRA